MKNCKTIFVTFTSYFFILLFMYTSASKIAEFETFQMQLAQSPVLGTYPEIVSFLVILVEIVIVILLVFQKSRLPGLYSSMGIMSAFTVYIYLILNYSDSIPCSCGGVIEKMDWHQHLLFNIICIILALIAIFINSRGNIIKAVSYTAALLVLPALSLIFIYYPHVNDNQGNFERKVIVPIAKEYQTLEFPMNNYYFAGNHGDTLFLGNRKTPLLLSTISPDFSSVHLDTIKLNNYHYEFASVTINVLYPYFSVSDGKVPVIFEGKLPSLLAYDSGINRLYFSRFYMLAPHEYVFKTMLVKTKESELGILNTDSKRYLIYPHALNAEIDGVFDTDGDITVDRENQQIMYTHFYRNEIITANFNLSSVRRKRTIDSLSKTRIETRTLKNGQTKLVKSPSVINQAQTVSHGKFYNISKMRGINESFNDFRKYDVIDVYENSSKKYLYSFYIKNEERIKIRSILSTKHYLYVLSGNTITRYTFK